MDTQFSSDLKQDLEIRKKGQIVKKEQRMVLLLFGRKCDLHLPELAADSIKKLTMVTLISNYNQMMTTDMEAQYTEQLEEHSCLKPLTTSFPNVHQFVLDILKVDKYQKWPVKIWTYKHNGFI